MRRLAFLLVLFAAAPAAAQTNPYTWQVGDGSWNVAANWLNGSGVAQAPPSNSATQLVFTSNSEVGYAATHNVGTGTFTLNRLTTTSGGEGTGAITIAGATTANTLTFAGTNPTLDIGGTVVFLGRFANAAQIRMVGSGTFLHDSDNQAFTGTLTLDGGKFVNRATTVATTNFNATGIVVNAGATYQFGDNTTGNPNLPNSTYITVNPGGTAVWEEGEDFGGINLNGGTIDLRVGGYNGQGTAPQVWTSGTLTGTGATVYTVTGTGASSRINKTTAGTVTVSGNAAIAGSGGLFIEEGTVNHVAASNLGTAAVTLGSATSEGVFSYQGATATRGNITAVNAGGGRVTVTDAAAVLTLPTAITGSGGFFKDGAGTVALTANNSYAGTTTVAAGVLKVGDATATGAVTGNVVVGGTGTFAFDRSDNLTFAGNFSGAGNLQKRGANAVTLSGTLGHTGTTTVSAGTLAVNAQAVGGAVTVADGATFAVRYGAAGDSFTASGLNLGAAGGTVRFDLNYAGNPSAALINVTMTDALTNAGGTHALQIAKSSPLAVGTFTLIDYSGAAITSGFSLAALPARTLGGLVYDTANTAINLNITAVDTIKWNGNVSADWDAGPSEDAGGTPNWKRASNGTATNFIPGDAVTFDDAAAGNFAVTLTAALAPASVTVNNAANAYTFQGPGSLTGTTGLTKQGTGTLTVLTDNTNTGTTAVTAGALAVGNGGTAGSFGTGDLVNNGAVTWNRSDNVTNAGAISGTGSLTKAGGNTLTLTGPYTLSGNTVIAGGGLVFNTPGTYTVPSSISGAGALTKDGPGTVTLTGTNTHTGGTTVANGGTLVVGDGGTTGSLTGPVTLAVNGSIAFNRSDDLTYAGDISGIGNFGKLGAGTLTLTGIHTYSGTTAVFAGTLRQGTGVGGAGQIPGGAAISAGATLEYNFGDDATQSANLTGAGGNILKSGPANLTLTGANTLTGTLTINGGRVILQDVTGGDLNVGNIVVNNGGAFQFGVAAGENPDLPDNTVITVNTGGTAEWRIGENFAGVQLQGGTLTFNGGGVTAVAGAAPLVWTNGTVNSLGTTAAGHGSTAIVNKTTAGTVTVSGLATVSNALNVQEGTWAIATAANVSGNAVTLGTASTAGVYEYRGATATKAGTLGLVGNGTVRVTDSGAALTLSGVVSGAGTLTKDGLGTVILSNANNTLSGGITVAAGTLLANGQTGTNSGTGTAAVTVDAGAAFGGTGRAAGPLTVNGTFTPGNAGVGTFTAAGAVAINGVFLADVAGTAGDKLQGEAAATVVLGAASTLALPVTNTYDPNTVFVLIDAPGGLTGTFGNFAEGAGIPGGSHFVTYTATQVQLAPVPEPGLILLAAGAGLAWARRRRAV